MTSPVTSKRFVIESANVAKTNRARNRHDILPLFVPLQNLNREPFELASRAFVLKNLPHPEIVYTIFSMSIDARNLPGFQTGRLTPAVSGWANRRPKSGSNLGDGLDGPLRRHCWTALCRGLEVLSNYSRMARGNSQQRESRAFGLPSTLFPVPQGMNTDLHGTGEFNLAKPDESSQCSDVIPRGNAFP